MQQPYEEMNIKGIRTKREAKRGRRKALYLAHEENTFVVDKNGNIGVLAVGVRAPVRLGEKEPVEDGALRHGLRTS